MKKIFIVSKTNFFYLFSLSFLKTDFEVKSKFLKYPYYDFSSRYDHFLSQYAELKKHKFYMKGKIDDPNDFYTTQKIYKQLVKDINTYSPDHIIIEFDRYREEDAKLIEYFTDTYPIHLYNGKGDNYYGLKTKVISKIVELKNISDN